MGAKTWNLGQVYRPAIVELSLLLQGDCSLPPTLDMFSAIRAGSSTCLSQTKSIPLLYIAITPVAEFTCKYGALFWDFDVWG